jgi:hypothetical protein
MRTVTLVIWSALLVVAVVLETAGRGGVSPIPPLERVLRGVRSAALGRGVLVLGWMWLGWHLFAR